MTLGGDPQALDAAPLGNHELPDYAIGKHPVSQFEFRRFLEAEGAAKGFRCWFGPESVPAEERLLLPALGVTYPAALAYADWLSRETGLRFRLPTNLEWEKAARGADARSYPWGNDWEPSYCNGLDGFSREPRPRPVGSGYS